MNRIVLILITVLFFAASLPGYGQSRAIVDFRADDAYPVPSGDTTVLALVGNVFFHHNGAILACDSAVRYSSDYIECFKNVIINRDSTFVYGDRADFNGVTNIAQVYAPIIKTVDGDMTMYSYDMEFNTLTNIGRFTQGGTISQKDNLMESIEAIYHADERDVFFVKDVVMRNEEYIIRTDSMGYNFDTELTTFYKPAQIWNKDGDFLSADKGSYDRLSNTYIFTENSYILTKEQEVFADSITYMNTAGLAYVFNNVQIHDQEQSAFLFGDYGVYWTENQQAIMTDNPSVIGYDGNAEEPDSVYMRGDTIFLHTIESIVEFTPEVASRLQLPGRRQVDSLRFQLQDSLMIVRPDSLLPDSLSAWGHLYGENADSTLLQYGMRGEAPPGDSLPPPLPGMRIDSLSGLPVPDSLMRHPADSTAIPIPPDSLPAGRQHPDSLSLWRPIFPESVNDFPLIVDPALGDSVRKTELPADPLLPVSVPEEPDSVQTQTTLTEIGQDDRPLTKREQRRQKRLEKRKEKMHEYAVEQGLIVPDSLPEIDTLPVDTLPEITPIDTLPKDSLQRVVRSFRNVKVYRHDMQAVCDSLIAFSIDSTAHMYIEPILWSEESQITADEVHIYSKDEQIDRADFEGDPLIAQWVIDSLFNQVAGDLMEAYFKNNEIIRLDVLDNSQSYYYMQEDSAPDEVRGFSDITSKDITILFDSMKISRITYKDNPVYSFFPMDKIPETQAQRFPHFKWMEHLRPKTQFEVCDRTIRPSRREESESIPYPVFRITNKMEDDKKRLTGQGVWRDREDTLSVTPSFFMNQMF